MTEFQDRVCVAIRSLPNGIGTLDQIAGVIGSNRVAVYSALNSLWHQGLACYFRSGDGGPWTVQVWGVEKEPDTDGGEG